VIFGDDLERDWQQIVNFGRPGAGAPAALPSAVPIFAPDDPPLPAPIDERRAGEHED
jgi:hypothetical protein